LELFGLDVAAPFACGVSRLTIEMLKSWTSIWSFG
jgi:hypothetical protein